MRQHPWDSLAEVVTNILIGFLISVLVYAWIINPLFDLHTDPLESTSIVAVFTFFSLVRQYVLRRLFDGKSPYVWFNEHFRD